MKFAPHIVFPRTMTAISDKMYEYLCLTDEIESIEVEEGNPVFRSVNNCLIESATGTLIMGCKNSIIPDDNTIKKIGKMAFATKGEVKKHNRPMLIPEPRANNVKIIAPKNSTAYEYAKKYEIEFEELK